MSDQSESSRLLVPFEAFLQGYEKQTGIALAKHPLADKFQNRETAESVIAVLHEQTEAFSEFRERDEVLKSLRKVVPVLCNLSASADFGREIGQVRP